MQNRFAFKICKTSHEKARPCEREKKFLSPTRAWVIQTDNAVFHYEEQKQKASCAAGKLTWVWAHIHHTVTWVYLGAEVNIAFT